MTETQTVSLTSLLVPSRAVTVDYPGLDGLEIDISFLARDELVKLRKKATKVTFKGGKPVEDLNEELFLKLYVEATIKGWSGFKYSYLNSLVLVDLSAIKDAEKTELPFTLENAIALMKGSTEFDSFISEKVNDLSVFSTAS